MNMIKKIIFVGLLLLGIMLLLYGICYGIEQYQPVNSEYKLFSFKTQFELYSSGIEKLYIYESPHGKFYNSQGWEHQEEVIIDFRRIKVDCGLLDYVPLYFSGYFKTYPYIPYADSLQIVGGKVGLILPIIPNFLFVKGEISPQSWSGHQNNIYQIGGIITSDFGVKNNTIFHIFNISFSYSRSSFISLLRYIDQDTGIKWNANSYLFGDITVDTRPLGGTVFCGYRIDYRWNTDGSNNQILDKKYIIQTLFLGQEFKIEKDISLEIEGSYNWIGHIRIMKINNLLIFRSNFI